MDKIARQVCLSVLTGILKDATLMWSNGPFHQPDKTRSIKNGADGHVSVYLPDILFMVLQSFVRHQWINLMIDLMTER